MESGDSNKCLGKSSGANTLLPNDSEIIICLTDMIGEFRMRIFSLPMKTASKPIQARRCFATTIAACILTIPSGFLTAQELTAPVRAQIAALNAEKNARTPAQKKMASKLIQLAMEEKGQRFAPGVDSLRPAKAGVTMNAQNLVEVDLDATVSEELVAAIKHTGGVIVNQFPAYNAIRAWVPPAALEGLAGRNDIRQIRPADRAETNVGAVTSQGNVTHAANTARTTFGVTGSGVKVGVLSDGVNSLANSKASGDLSSTAIFLAGQAGNGDEGTAMMEIVQDLAPGADIIFATAFNGTASMAANIIALQAAGCSVIVDDVTYFSESPFQDGVISQAVTSVSDLDCVYFSSAANSGNKNDGTSGTWEGDFVSGGSATGPLAGAGILHDFGGGVTQNVCTRVGGRVTLHWSDPLGASANDYDIYVLNSSGTSVVASATGSQTGTQDPYELINRTLAVGERVVIVRFSGSDRFLHMDTGRGRMTVNTEGNTRGHNASGAANAFCVAATPVSGAFPGVYNSGDVVETFSSDGPRRIFYTPDGTPITPGNVSSTGGLVLNKPDITAADGGSTTVPGFTTFFGTSAAAPHAAAIAALMRSANPSVTGAQIRTALYASAIDIEAPGFDRDSGAGIIMADAALAATPGYSIWASVNAPGGGPPEDDFDEDGVNNGVEYLLGGSKETNDIEKLPIVSAPGDDLKFVFQRNQTSIDGSTVVNIQVGTDLEDWPLSSTFSVPDTAVDNNPGVKVEKDVPAGKDTITLTLPRGADLKKFSRLQVIPTP